MEFRSIVKYCPFCGSSKLKIVKTVPRCTNCYTVLNIGHSRIYKPKKGKEMLLTDLQTKMTQARKSGDRESLNILSVIIGDLSTLKARNNKDVTEDQIENLIRGLRDKNNETLTLLAGKSREADEVRLNKENAYLTSLLPITLTVEEIKVALAEIRDQLIAAKAGAAVGVAMKFLKPKGLKVLGDDVKIAVEQLKQ